MGRSAMTIFGAHQGELKPNSSTAKANRSYRSNHSNRADLGRVSHYGFYQCPSFISKSVIGLCQARKSRDADHLQNFVYDRDMIDGGELLKSIGEARANPENIPLPEYTFDVHTRKGRAQGKTKADFFQQEFTAMRPKEPREFDQLIE